jgi:hypothetical protein
MDSSRDQMIAGAGDEAHQDSDGVLGQFESHLHSHPHPRLHAFFFCTCRRGKMLQKRGAHQENGFRLAKKGRGAL